MYMCLHMYNNAATYVVYKATYVHRFNYKSVITIQDIYVFN